MSEVELMYVVASGVPFCVHQTTALLSKPVPVTVSVNCAAPALTDDGLIDVMTGDGILTCG